MEVLGVRRRRRSLARLWVRLVAMFEEALAEGAFRSVAREVAQVHAPSLEERRVERGCEEP